MSASSPVVSSQIEPSVSISVSGEVERPATLTGAQLEALADSELTADFKCREGWIRRGEHWQGVKLSTLLEHVGCRESARYVTISAGEYRVVLSRKQLEDQGALLAVAHKGAASPRPAGLPRLVGPSEWDCFMSVKSVDRIELTQDPADATAETIALGRLAS